MKYIIFLLFTFSLTAQEVKLPLDSITNCELRYIYFPNIKIIESKVKPRIGYSVYNGYFIQITDYDGDYIFDLLEKHKKLYPYISSRNRGKK